MLIKVKKWEHYNHSLGKYITSKAHYEKEMARQGMVSYDEGCRIAERARKENHKPYEISEKARHIINTAKMSADRKGRVKLGDRAIKAMQDMGMDFNRSRCPEHYKPTGGWK